MKNYRLLIGLLLASWAFVGACCAALETKVQIEYEQSKDITYDPMLH